MFCCDFRVVVCSDCCLDFCSVFCSDVCSDFCSDFRSGLRSAQLGAPTGAVHSRETAGSQIVSVVSGPPRVTTTAHAHNSAHILHIIGFLGLLPGAPGIWPLGSRCAAQLLRAARQWCSSSHRTFALVNRGEPVY